MGPIILSPSLFHRNRNSIWKGKRCRSSPPFSSFFPSSVDTFGHIILLSPTLMDCRQLVWQFQGDDIFKECAGQVTLPHRSLPGHMSKFGSGWVGGSFFWRTPSNLALAIINGVAWSGREEREIRRMWEDSCETCLSLTCEWPGPGQSTLRSLSILSGKVNHFVVSANQIFFVQYCTETLNYLPWANFLLPFY